MTEEQLREEIEGFRSNYCPEAALREFLQKGQELINGMKQWLFDHRGRFEKEQLLDRLLDLLNASISQDVRALEFIMYHDTDEELLEIESRALRGDLPDVAEIFK